MFVNSNDGTQKKRRLPALADSFGIAQGLDEDSGESAEYEGSDEGYDEGDGGGTEFSDVADELSNLGVPDDIVEKVRKGTMLHGDYTRKRQTEAEQLRKLEQENAWMRGALEGSGGNKKSAEKPSKVKEILGKIREANPEAADEMERLAEAIQDDAEERIGRAVKAQLEPDLQLVRKSQVNAVKGEARKQLQDAFGKGSSKYFDKVWDAQIKLLQSGRTVPPDWIFLKMYPEEAADLLVARRKQKDKRRADSTLTGQERARSKKPMGGDSKAKGAKDGSPMTASDILDTWRRQRKREGLPADLH